MIFTVKNHTFEINLFVSDAIRMSKKQLNRIKVVLVESNKSNKWLAQKKKKNEATISRWCTNDVQPSLETLTEIAAVLRVKVTQLIKD